MDEPTYGPQRALDAPSETSPANRGQIFILPAGTPPWTTAKQALRLDSGCWDIRAGLVGDGITGAPGVPLYLPNFLQASPGSKDPLFPVGILFAFAAGGVRWTEGAPLVARGVHWIRSAEYIDIQIATVDAQIPMIPLAEELRILVVAVKVAVPCEPAHYIRTDQQEVAAGNVGQFYVPQGAWRVRFYGPNLLLRGTWKDATGNKLHTTNGVTFSVLNNTPPELIVPSTAALFETEVIANGGLFAPTWDCQT